MADLADVVSQLDAALKDVSAKQQALNDATQAQIQAQKNLDAAMANARSLKTQIDQQFQQTLGLDTNRVR